MKAELEQIGYSCTEANHAVTLLSPIFLFFGLPPSVAATLAQCQLKPEPEPATT